MGTKPDAARDRLARLLRLARNKSRALVATQDHPDPDGLASAAALKRLLEEKAHLPTTIAAAGQSTRAENRAALQFLGEQPAELPSLDIHAFDLRALVDTQPGFNNHSMPRDIPIHLVIDHHPRGEGIAPGTVADIRPDYGATATILTEYLRAARITPSTQLATILLYGIKSDTQDLSRGASRADTRAFLYLYPLANQRALAMIERERLPRAYFTTLARALRRCRLYDSAAICWLGPVPSPDTLSELADFFLRIEGVWWVLCHGIVERRIHLSVRTVLRKGAAGQLVAKVLDGIGEGGGHDMLAGGQAPLPADDEAAAEALAREIELRFLRLLEIPTRTPRPLLEDIDAIEQPSKAPQPPAT